MNDKAKAYRLRFIETLSTLDESARMHLLAFETEAERATLFDLALSSGFPGVAASIEVYHDNHAEV